MKISFTKLVTTKPEVEVKADTYTSAFYKVEAAKTNGITLNTDVFKDLDTIQIGGSKTKPTFTAEQNASFIESAKKYTITYVDNNNNSNVIFTKTVEAGYVLTDEDLWVRADEDGKPNPDGMYEINHLSNSLADETKRVVSGTVVNSDITLLCYFGMWR